MRSKPLVPSLSAWRVSEGTPTVASRARMTISCAPVLTSSGLPQTTTTVSSAVALTALRTASHLGLERVSAELSEWTMLGSLVRQATTRTRSEISREKRVFVCVGQARRSRKPRRTTAVAAGHALDLDPRAAADADVDVLAGGAHAGPHVTGAADEPAQDLGHLGDLLRRPHVGTGDGLDEGHAQAVGQVGPAVADIADLAAGVLLESELDDRDSTVVVGDGSVDAEDGRALEAGRDAAVEVLLAGDVDLVDEVEAVEQGDAEGPVEGLLVDHERRGVVHLVGADRLPVDPVDDLLAGLELHQGRAVVLAELGQWARSALRGQGGHYSIKPELIFGPGCVK
ncbi:MAG: hypothetical protein H6P96_1097 [Candidatus Aminicenantes bacterium]|nr:hypothetical protein [Candidatus Aminicenantes bacterium]